MKIRLEHVAGPASGAIWLVAGGALIAVLASLAFPRIEAGFISRAQTESVSALRFVTDGVNQTVARYEPLPGLIADDPILVELLRNTNNQGIVPFVNEKLRLAALSVGASDVYVMDRAGRTVATSNYRDPASFLGRNFSFRPYFQRAVQGETAQFHALGTTSNERGFFFSAPILDGIEVVGVLAVKIVVDAIEDTWQGFAREVIVADANGVAFLASRSDYRLRSLVPLTDGARARIADTRQFPLGAISPIPFSANVLSAGAVEVTLGQGRAAARYLSESTPLSLAGWHAIVLTPLSVVRSQAVNALIMLVLALTVTGLAALVLFQRRARLLERVRLEREQNDILESKVRERTADLDATNVNLRSEIAERQRTEDQLRKTQKELIQAGKLAALGKMSAALSHEINQPLAAVKSYADNAAQFLKRNRVSEAEDNIGRISAMADRMAEISRHLRTFARQPGDALVAVPVQEVVQEAIALVEPHGRKAMAHILFNRGSEEVWAIGGRLRLQQVVINTLNNALDAMQDRPNPKIELSVWAEQSTVHIQVRDHGPGVPPESLDQVFDAFYTTKDAGAGMGLGMSISHNIVSDFGGALTAENHPDGGAIFSVVLRRQDAPEGADVRPMSAS